MYTHPEQNSIHCIQSCGTVNFSLFFGLCYGSTKIQPFANNLENDVLKQITESYYHCFVVICTVIVLRGFNPIVLGIVQTRNKKGGRASKHKMRHNKWIQ